MNDQVKKLIAESQNICLVSSENEPESFTAALALFYTLKELRKNVNLIADDHPEKLDFLIPPIDFLSVPKNLVIAVPKAMADVSQIYYEKNDDVLKIHLTLDKGGIKKEDISFYYEEPKPDLIITLGVKDFHQQLENRLDSFGYLLGCPIVNIDIKNAHSANIAQDQENKLFGQVNIIENDSFTEAVLEIIESLEVPQPPLEGNGKLADQENKYLLKKNVANCLLTGLMIRYQNFKEAHPEVFQLTAELIKKGADLKQIRNNLSSTSDKELNFLSQIFQNFKTIDKTSVALLDSQWTQDFSEAEAAFAVDKIKEIGFPKDVLVLWGSHNSPFTVKGLFYSKNREMMSKIAASQQGLLKKDWVFLFANEPDIYLAQEKILKIITTP